MSRLIFNCFPNDSFKKKNSATEMWILLPSPPADEDHSLSAGPAWSGLCVCWHLEYGWACRNHRCVKSVSVTLWWAGASSTGGSPPPRSLQSWVTCCGLGHTPDDSTALLPHDIYALGTQENPQGEKEWTEHIKATLRSHTHVDFKLVNCFLHHLLFSFARGFLCLNVPLINVS